MSKCGSVLDLPVSNLDAMTVGRLGGELTLRNTMDRDWTGVAALVGFTHKQVEHLIQHNDAGKGNLFLNAWEAIGDCSVRKLMLALMELKMKRIIDLIKEDSSFSDEDIQVIESEFEQRKQEGSLKPSSPIQDQVFFQVLYGRLSQSRPVYTATRTGECQIERYAGQQCASPDLSREPRTVFISYMSESGFSKPTKPSVNKLAEFISHNGFKVHYKPFCEKEAQSCGLNEWKEHCITRSEVIIVVCTPAYVREDLKCVSSQMSHSIKPSKLCVDSRLLRTLAYTPSERKRLIPVTLDPKKPAKECIPIWLQSSQVHHWPSAKENLIYSLNEKPRYVIEPPRPEDIIVVKPKVIGFPKQHRPRNHRD